MSFSLWNTRVTISFWALFSICYGVVLSGSGQSVLLIGLISAFFHELGHILLILKYSKIPSSIHINPFEVKINCDLSAVTPLQDLIITIAGPLVNFLLCVASWILLNVYKIKFFEECLIVNLSLLFLNCLPVATTDGGQMLCLILTRFFSEKTISVVLRVLTILVILPIGILGFYVLINSRYNFSLLSIGIYLLLIFINKELR